MKKVIITIAISLIEVCLITSARSGSPDKEYKDTRTQEQITADSAITTAVIAKLLSHRDIDLRAIDLRAIEVSTEGKTVYLIGQVDSQEQKMRVEKLVREVDGVARVINVLNIEYRDDSGVVRSIPGGQVGQLPLPLKRVQELSGTP